MNQKIYATTRSEAVISGAAMAARAGHRQALCITIRGKRSHLGNIVAVVTLIKEPL